MNKDIKSYIEKFPKEIIAVISYYFDIIGTFCVSIYLIYSGIDSLIKINKHETL